MGPPYVGEYQKLFVASAHPRSKSVLAGGSKEDHKSNKTYIKCVNPNLTNEVDNILAPGNDADYDQVRPHIKALNF